MALSIFLIILSPYTALIPVVYTTYKLITRKLIIYKNPWNLGLLFLFLWAVLSGIINQSLMSTVTAAAILLYFSLSVYLQNYFDTVDKIEGLFKYFLYFSMFSAILGIIEKISFMFFDNPLWKKLLGIVKEIPANHRIYSTFGNPNVAGAWFAAMILLSLYLKSNSSKKQKSFYNAAIILFVFALYLTGSRGAELGLLLGLVSNYLFKQHKKNVWIFITLLVLIIFIAFTPFEIFNIRNLMYRGISYSFSDRYSIWEGCFKMIQQKPISGWGLFGIYENSKRFILDDMPKFHGHNIWISLTAMLGSVGLLIYLYMKFYLFKGLKSLYTSNCRLVPLFASIQAIIIGQGLVDFTIMTPQVGLLFISSSALIFSLNKKHNTVILSKPKIFQSKKSKTSILN